MTALLAVVIPTFRRPRLLKRAIASAFNAAPDSDLEVVVVPNGADTSWKRVAEEFESDPRISWHPLALGNACAARNYGLAHARSKYVRFLDDDDYLYQESSEQLELIEARGVEACSAPLENILANGEQGHVFTLPASEDFPTTALLSIGISGLTQGSIFRKSVLSEMTWREDTVLYDDYYWMLDLSGSRELDWFQSRTPVGAYVHHHSARLSHTRRSRHNSEPLVASILGLHERLERMARVTPERTRAVATALLTHAHSAFPSSPFFLSRTIKQARAIDPTALPIQPAFHDYPWLAQDVLLAEWAMIAPRYLTRSSRRAYWFVKEMFEQIRPKS